MRLPTFQCRNSLHDNLLMQSNDPDIRKYEQKNDLVACPQCHGWMLPLNEFEIQKSSAPSVEAEPWEFLLWGWSAYLYNFIFDSFTYESRKRKLAQQKRDTLPQFPKSFVVLQLVSSGGHSSGGIERASSVRPSPHFWRIVFK